MEIDTSSLMARMDHLERIFLFIDIDKLPPRLHASPLRAQPEIELSPCVAQDLQHNLHVRAEHDVIGGQSAAADIDDPFQNVAILNLSQCFEQASEEQERPVESSLSSLPCNEVPDNNSSEEKSSTAQSDDVRSELVDEAELVRSGLDKSDDGDAAAAAADDDTLCQEDNGNSSGGDGGSRGVHDASEEVVINGRVYHRDEPITNQVLANMMVDFQRRMDAHVASMRNAA